MIVIGAGGLGRCVEDFFEVAAFVDDGCKESSVNGVPVLGGVSKLLELASSNKEIIQVVFALGTPETARQIHEKLHSSPAFANLAFPSLIHPSASVSRHAKVGIGAIVFPHSVIGPNAVIGNFCFLNTSAVLSHDAHLGDFCRLHGGSRVLGWTQVGDSVSVGSQAVVRDRLTIGNNVEIGCGTTLVSDMGSNLVVAGNPGRVLRNLAPVAAAENGKRSRSSEEFSIPVDNSRLTHPLHGHLLKCPFPETVLDLLHEKMKSCKSNGRGSHYQQTVYNPLLYEEIPEIKDFLHKTFPHDRPLADLIFQQGETDSGFSWHCDYDSNFILEDPTVMFSLWFTLTDITSETGARLQFTADHNSILLARMETFSRVYHGHPACGVAHPWGSVVLPILHERAIALDMKRGDCLVFSNHIWHKPERVKKEGFARTSYVIRMIPKNARFHRGRAEIASKRFNPFKIDQKFLNTPDIQWVDEPYENSKEKKSFSEKNSMAVFEGFWMKHYGFQEAMATRLVMDATENSSSVWKLLESGVISPPTMLSSEWRKDLTIEQAEELVCLSISEEKRTILKYHHFLQMAAAVHRFPNHSFAGTPFEGEETRLKAVKVVEFVRRRPEWAFQIRLTQLDGPNGFFYPPGWTLDSLDHYLKAEGTINESVMVRWQKQCNSILSALEKSKII